MNSRIIDLKTAVYEIFSAYENREHEQPFFIVAGAGVSAPTIPLAGEIISHCKAKAAAYQRTVGAEPSGIEGYSYWFDRAYPQPVDRQRYLRSLIQNKPITDACLRLAHLLGSGRVVNLVVTTNFDDLISRALNIFATPYTVCDHPETVDRIDLASDDIKIVHAHGSYKFYDCRNLREELEDRARPSARTVRTMAAFLDRALSFSSPLVIGYSGWEGDVVMSAMRRRIEGSSLPYRLYWFCYERDSVRELEARAPWLTEHPDVRFVVPEEQPMEGSNNALATGGEPLPPTLPARVVCEEINRTFHLVEPELTRDPIRFFANQLKSIIFSDGGPASLQGVYSFATVVARLDRAAELEAAEFGNMPQMDTVGSLEGVRRLLRESQYAQALNAISLLADSVQQADRLQLFELLESSFSQGELSPDDKLRRANLLLELSVKISSIQQQSNYGIKRIKWLIQKGEALSKLNRHQAAVTTYDDLLSDYGGSSDEEIARQVRYALTRKALALGKIGREEEEVILYEALIPKLCERPSERWLAVQSAFNRSVALGRMGKIEESVPALLEFIAANYRAPDGWTQVLVLAAARNAARSLDAQGESIRALILLNDVSSLYSANNTSQVRRALADTLLELAHLQEKTGALTEALESLDKLTGLSFQDFREDLSQEAQTLRRAIDAKRISKWKVDSPDGNSSGLPVHLSAPAINPSEGD